MLFQYIALATESMTSPRIVKSLKGGICCGVTIAITAVELQTELYSMPAGEDISTLLYSDIGLAIIALLLSCSIPCRHQAFRHGKMIDGEGSSSVIGHLSFAWATPLIEKIGNNLGIELECLPELNDKTRARPLYDEFDLVKRNMRLSNRALWQTLLYLYRRHIIWQVALSMPLALLAFSPHVALGKILLLLESRTEGQTNNALLVRWAVILGFGIGVSSWLEHWLLWIAQSRVSIPLTQQLSIALFDKVTRLTLSSNVNEKNEDPGPQSAMNLAAIDGPRIATIAGFLYSCILQPLKVIVACILLSQLLGWQSLSVGLLCLILTSPIHSACLKRISTAEGVLMRSRDKKMNIVTEAFHGIRHIKFAALESKWEAKINMQRDEELRSQKIVFHWQILTLALHLLGPVLVTTASLGMYGWLYGRLIPSVAFPALSIFGYLQFILGIIPELLSGIIAASVSMKRVEQFLKLPEQEQQVSYGDCIGIVADFVSYDYPVDLGHNGVLCEVNLRFPHQGLSLICGGTGVGKSLLLSAVLGESVISSGTIKRPKPPLFTEIYTQFAPGTSWIVETMIAYVAQTPWIEAGTVRSNIVFGLPFDAQRYQKVLHACALIHDLNEFDGHDLTDIGPSGINLSGGQKARISLARALYSRAGILLLDDIFSAVDVHTAKHLLLYALTGELAEGRTRVLVTHNLELSLPKADYLVHVENGKIKCAGKVHDLRMKGDTGDGKRLVEAGENDKRDSPISSSQMSNAVSGATNDATPCPILTGAPKKLVQEEGREQGAAQWSLFRRYVVYSGGWSHWAILASCYAAYNVFILAQVSHAAQNQRHIAK